MKKNFFKKSAKKKKIGIYHPLMLIFFPGGSMVKNLPADGIIHYNFLSGITDVLCFAFFKIMQGEEPRWRRTGRPLSPLQIH